MNAVKGSTGSAGSAVRAGRPRALAFSCSPRGENGATGLLLRHFMEGFVEGGGEAEVLNPYELRLEPCRGCFHCWTRTLGKCRQGDDMAGVLEKLGRADILIFATPVYHFTMSEGMKRVLERTLPMMDPRVEKRADGRARHARLGRKDQRAFLLSVCGFPELEVFDSLRTAFREVCELMDWRLSGELLRTMAGMLLSADAGPKKAAAGYLELVREAGRRAASGKDLGAEERATLERDLVPREEYFIAVNRYFMKK
jgi:multimeric flavodoxin WrbA